MLVERDILAGHLAPGSRLGIVDLVQRYEIGATPLREGLSRLMSRRTDRRHRTARLSRRSMSAARICSTSPPCAPQSKSRPSGWRSPTAMTPGRPALSARCTRCVGTSNAPAIEFREGAEDFDRLHKGFHTALLDRLRLKTPAGSAFRSLRPGLSLSPGDDAYVRQRQELRAGASIAGRPRHRARRSRRAGDAGSASALDPRTSSILRRARAEPWQAPQSVSNPFPASRNASDRVRRGHARSSAARPSSRISASASGRANSSASSARPAAARPRRCVWRPVSTSRPAAR